MLSATLSILLKLSLLAMVRGYQACESGWRRSENYIEKLKIRKNVVELCDCLGVVLRQFIEEGTKLPSMEKDFFSVGHSWKCKIDEATLRGESTLPRRSYSKETQKATVRFLRLVPFLIPLACDTR
jgi:hypothetical protein